MVNKNSSEGCSERSAIPQAKHKGRKPMVYHGQAQLDKKILPPLDGFVDSISAALT